MSYTIQYNQPTKAARMRAALEDAHGYLGVSRGQVETCLQHVLQAEGKRGFCKAYPLILSFAGLHGAPARAMALATIQGK